MAGVAVTATAVVVVMLRNPDTATAGNIPFAAVPLAVSFVAGRVLRSRARSHSEDRARAQRLEAEREADIQVALAEERSRIARELHDIVAHCVSVMVVQAGAAEDLLDRDPGRARAPLRSVQDTGQQAVAELGRMLGLLRADGGRQSLAPQPGIAQLTELAEHMAGTGLPVEFSVQGSRTLLPARRGPRPLPAGAGGADQRAQARRGRPRLRSCCATTSARAGRRSPTTAGPVRRRRAHRGTG